MDGDRRTTRGLPHSVEAEQAVLGGLMLRPAALAEISDWISEPDFYRRDHQCIYRAILELAEKDKPFDAVTIGEWFESMGMAEQVAGGAYLVELATNTPSSANIKAYAEIVLEKSQWRQLIAAGTDAVNASFQPVGRDLAEVKQEFQRRLSSLGSDHKTGPESAKVCLEALYEDLVRRFELNAMPGLPTPWRELNEITHGLQDGEVVVIAARSNMGKSVVGFQLSAFNALRGNRTVRFSLEMTKTQATRRDAAALGNIPYTWMLDPRDGDHWSRLSEAIKELRGAPLLTDDTPRLSASQIAARAQREHLRAPVRMVLVDHLHEVKLPGKHGEVVERADALRDLKALAKRLGCPVVVLAQLNRGASKDPAEARRPRLTDLRGSGGIEEVADVVLFLHRPDYYKPDDMPGVIEVIVGKGRDIPTGKTIYLQNRFDVMRADDWEGPPPVTTATRQQSRRGFEPGH
jgi:replicative DNA helicase